MSLTSKVRMGGRSKVALALAGVIATAVAVSGCGGSSSGGSSSKKSSAPESQIASTWSQPNATLHNTRAVKSSISSANVSKLRVAWRLPLTHAGVFGYYANTPVVGEQGRIYFQDLAYNVFAVDGQTGKTLWTHSSGRNKASLSSLPIGEGPNGVALVNGTLYGEAPAYAFALSAATGKVLWRTPNLAEKQGQGFNMAPQVSNGRVYLSTSGQLHGGVAYALDAKTGKVLWKFQETKNPAERSAGGMSGTGGAWNTPAVGPDGTVYFGIANPYRSIDQAINHPTRLPYNDSTIALDPSGQLKWSFQGVPNDFHDWDMQVSPIYAKRGGQPVIVDAGKMGYVYVMNANTGTLLWKTPVGKHNGHDNDGVLALQHKFHPKLPYVYYPGIYGGVETNMAVADGVIYVPLTNLFAKFTSRTQKLATNGPFAKGTGEVVALSLSTGKVLWDRKLRHTPYGDATVTNDLVFTTTYDGKVLALSRKTGAIVWQEQLPAGTNSPVSVDGKTLIAVASFPQGQGQRPEIVAYRLGAKQTSSSAAGAATAPSSGSGSNGSKTSPSTSTKGTTVQVKGGEFFFRLSTKSASKPGAVTFVFQNIGHIEHDFSINGKTTPLLQPGSTAQLVVSFAKNGKYPYLCTVPGHAEAGMKGTFTVG